MMFCMSHCFNSLKGGTEGIISGTTTVIVKGDTRSLDNGSYGVGMTVWGLGSRV